VKAIPYWIQRADFSATEYDPVEVAEGVRAFETHDWRRELDLYSELEGAGAECCPPEIGFMDASGDILHICPDGNGRAMVHSGAAIDRGDASGDAPVSCRGPHWFLFRRAA
jgi:hypothetical protein